MNNNECTKSAFPHAGSQLQSSNLSLPSRLFLQCQHYAVKLGVTDIISIWQWVKNARNVSSHGCIFAMKHFFEKSLES